VDDDSHHQDAVIVTVSVGEDSGSLNTRSIVIVIGGGMYVGSRFDGRMCVVVINGGDICVGSQLDV